MIKLAENREENSIDMKLLYPDLYLESIYELDFNELSNRGIKGLIADLDNTLVAWKNPELSDKLICWIQEAKNYHIKICIVSNNNSKRVLDFAEKVGLPAVPNANKPRRKGFQQALNQLELPYEDVAVIGDQIFTDIWGANRMGMFSILVVPIDKKEFFGTRILRMLERIVLRSIIKNNS